jgi:hypothetical protein
MPATNIWKHRLAWATGLLPCVLAVLVHVVWPSQPQAFELPLRPALVFDQYLVNLGKVQPANELRATFVYHNRSDRPVTIAEVAPSCGCLVPFVSSKASAANQRQYVVEPGEDGYIVLRMLPANESPGRREYFIDVKYADVEPRSVRLTFRLELPEQAISVRPRALMVYQNGKEPLRREITVTDSREQPARITEASTNNPLVRVAPGDDRFTARGHREYTLNVTVEGNVPPGRHEAIITIRTDDAHSSELRVPVIIQGQTEEAALP